MFLVTGSKVWGRLKTVGDLDSVVKKMDSRPIGSLREGVRILAIDDRGFPPKMNLEPNGFKNIDFRPNIDAIEDVKNYQIILVDLNGVGSHLNESLQGAHIIKQTKLLYPHIQIIAFSGEFGSNLKPIAEEYADKFLAKTADIDLWCDTLDKFTRIALNPKHPWEKALAHLHQIGTSNIDMALMEHYYVVSVLDPSASNIKKLQDRAALTPSVRGIVDSVIGSMLFEILKGHFTR